MIFDANQKRSDSVMTPTRPETHAGPRYGSAGYGSGSALRHPWVTRTGRPSLRSIGLYRRLSTRDYARHKIHKYAHVSADTTDGRSPISIDIVPQMRPGGTIITFKIVAC